MEPIEPEPIPLINDFNPFPVVPEALAAVLLPNAFVEAGGGFGGGVAGIFPPDGGGADAGAGFDDGAGPEPDILILCRGISIGRVEPLLGLASSVLPHPHPHPREHDP